MLILSSNRVTSSDMRMRRFIRQTVKVTGLGDTSFAQALDHLERAHLKISNNFADGAVEDYQPSMFNTFGAIEAGCRYLTKKNGANASDHIDFVDGVDPDGTLRSLMGDDYIHTEDNKVDYFESRSDEGSGTSMRSVSYKIQLRIVLMIPADKIQAHLSFKVSCGRYCRDRLLHGVRPDQGWKVQDIS
jgi:hypothetical protein